MATTLAGACVLGCPPHAGLQRSDSTTAAETRAVLLSREQPLMGTRFAVQVYTDDEQGAAAAIDEVYRDLAALEERISEWRETSEISAINREAGRAPVRVGSDMLRLTELALEAGALTGGAFDVTFRSCGQFWSFAPPRIPSESELAHCMPNVGWQHVMVDREAGTIFLPREGMALGVGGIGKGYGVDVAGELLERRGFHHYVVDGGGDVRVSGTNAGRPWRVGVADPRNRGALLGLLEVQSGAVVTSGDYERHFELDGVAYHHILDPRTAQPARASIATTVIAPNATLADALSTGLFVLGPEAGIALAEQLDGVEAFIVGADGSHAMTDGFRAQFVPIQEAPP